MEEKSHSDLLVDLISHDIGNHHSIVQAATELTIDMVQQKLSDYDNPNMDLPFSNTNSKNISHYDFE